MRLWFILLIAAFIGSCSTTKYVEKSSDFDSRSVNHKTIALLPAYIVQSNPKLNAEAEEYGYKFQQQLYNVLSQQAAKNTEGHTIAFQPLEKTNDLLKRNNIFIEGAYLRRPEELAKILEADAVLLLTVKDKGNFTQSGAFGISGGRSVYNSNAGPNANATALEIKPTNVDMSATIYDGTDGKLIWRTYHKGGTDLPSKMDGLSQYISDWVAKRLPYKN
jgi:hypothetical protein